MTVEVAIIISGVSLAFGIYQGVFNMKRNEQHDAKNDASEMTTVIVKLEGISGGIGEIKHEISNIKNESKENRERLIKVEESAKQAHKRLDELCIRRIPDEN